MPTREELKAKEKQLVGMLRQVRKYTADEKRGMAGGWNKKDIQEHVENGTYREDRHGPLPAAELGLKKPPGIVKATARSQSKWIRNISDEHAVRNGCRFNERLAEYTAEFFPKFLCHSKGEWGGKPFELSDWQKREVIYPLFGWVRPDGRRRFRRSYIEMPKKNGKSTIASGIGLYMLVGDGEPGAEIWSLGADRDQARIVHNEAINMIEASPQLSAVMKINKSNFNILHQSTRSWYRAVSGSSRGKQGSNLHCAIIDELHEWHGAGTWERLRYAFIARREPLSFVITNAGDDLQGICYRQREKADGVLSGAIIDDDYFAMILAVSRDQADKEIAAVGEGVTELPVARECNPGIGSIISEQDMARDIKDAIHTPSEMPNLLRLRYGIWNTGVNAWLNSVDWQGCLADFSDSNLQGASCAAGLDMSRVKDMTAMVLIFPDEDELGTFRQLAYFWMPEKTMRDDQRLVDYKTWVDAGLLRVGGENVVESDIVEADIKEIFSRFDVKQMAFDPMYVDETRLGDLYPDTEAVKFPQTIMHFAAPTAEYERLVVDGKLLHNGNDVLTWQAGHCCVKSDLNRNIRPVKPEHGDIRTIDGLAAGVMALRLVMGEDAASAYEDENVPMYADDVEDEDMDMDEDEMEYSGNEEEGFYA